MERVHDMGGRTRSSGRCRRSTRRAGLLRGVGGQGLRARAAGQPGRPGPICTRSGTRIERRARTGVPVRLLRALAGQRRDPAARQRHPRSRGGRGPRPPAAGRGRRGAGRARAAQAGRCPAAAAATCGPSTSRRRSRWGTPCPPRAEDAGPRTPGCRRTRAARPARSTALRPAQVFPDTAAYFIGENPQHVYTVELRLARAVGRRRGTGHRHHRSASRATWRRRNDRTSTRRSNPASSRRCARRRWSRCCWNAGWSTARPIDTFIQHLRDRGRADERGEGRREGVDRPRVQAVAAGRRHARRSLRSASRAAGRAHGGGGEHAEVHNVVVCTLCSCYPWPVLGLPPSWYKDPAYRSRVVQEPRAVLAEWGTELAPDVEVRVLRLQLRGALPGPAGTARPAPIDVGGGPRRRSSPATRWWACARWPAP